MLKTMIYAVVLVLTATATLAAPGDDRGGPQGMVAMVAMSQPLSHACVRACACVRPRPRPHPREEGGNDRNHRNHRNQNRAL